MNTSELKKNDIIASGKDTLKIEEPDEPPGSLQMLRFALYAETKHRPSNNSLDFLQKHFPQASLKDWNSWKWQIKNSFTSMKALSHILQLNHTEVGFQPGQNANLPLRITPYYASLLSPADSSHPLRKSVVPVLNEFIISPEEVSDPLSEDHDTVVPHIIHRYPDRVLFLVTGFCAAYCRYCTRSHMVASQKCHLNRDSWLLALQYIQQHKEIRDVLISGGDVLTMSDNHIRFLLSSLKEIPHVEMIRMGTKVPMVLPQRITKNLVGILKQHHPLFMSIHATHPDEITPECSRALQMLADAGIPLGSQTVLLKGINDNVSTMKELMHKLLQNRVKPYYLYQCDPVPGSAHFRTPVSKGLEIIEGLRGHTSGYAVPHFVIDAPGGGGKIPLLPDYFQKRENGNILLKNYEGKFFSYPDFD